MGTTKQVVSHPQRDLELSQSHVRHSHSGAYASQ